MLKLSKKDTSPTSAAEITVKLTGDLHKKSFVMPTKLLRYDTIGRIELIPSIVLSSNNTNCKNDIQLFLQLFDELSVYRDYH